VPSQEYADPQHSQTRLVRFNVLFTVSSPHPSAQPHQIATFDVSKDFSTLVCGFTDGTLSLYALPELAASSTPYPPRQFHSASPFASGRVHLSNVVGASLSSWSGSNKVVISAGADFRVCISAVHNSAPQGATSTADPLKAVTTLTGHTRALTALAELDSPLVASGAKDGTVRLWNVHSGTSAGSLAVRGLKTPNALAHAPGEPHILWAALSDGAVQALDTRTRSSAQIIEPAAVACGSLGALAVADDGTLYIGGARGVLGVLDPRAGRLLARWTRGEASVETIAVLPGQRVLVGSEDGLPYVVDTSGGGVRLEAELVFGDVEAVRCARVRGGGRQGWISGDGGVVRRYSL